MTFGCETYLNIGLSNARCAETSGITKQVFCYYERLQKLELEGSDSLVRHAYSEVKLCNFAVLSR